MAEQRVDIYNVVDKDGNVVDTLRYPQGGSLYEGAKSNREAGASNIVYGGTGEQEDYEPLFTNEDVKAATSISINEDTGKITIKAPKMVTESESFKQAINQDVLKQASQAYKLNKDYKLPYDEYDKETGETKQTEITIPEYISKINESVKSLASDIVTARYLRSYYAKNLNEKAANLSDAQVQMSTDFKNGVIPIPEFLHSIKGFRNIDKYLQDGYIKEDDFRKNFYNRDNLDREDMAALMAILNTALKTGSWSKDEYYEGEDGEQVFDRYNATEMAKAIALRDYILSKDPDQTWLQSVAENVGTFGINALYGADRVFFNIANVGQKVTTFGQGNEMQNYIKDMDKAFGEYNEEGKLINDATAVTSWLGVIGGSIAGSWAAGKVAGSALEYVGGKVGAAYTNAYNSTMEGAMKAAGIKKGAATTKAIADGTLTQSAVLAMAAENGYEIAKGAAFVVKMMPFVAKVNLVNNLAHAYLAQHTTLNFAVKFLMDTFHDALVFDSTTLFDALQSSDQETRNYWMGQLVDNGKWWIGMAGARGLLKFSGKTVIGQWLNAHSTKLVNKFEAWAGDKWTNFKDRVNGGSLVRKLQGKLDEALEENKPKKARRLRNKIEQLEFNEQLRNARRELGNIELETKPGSLRLTDESMAKYLEQTNAVRAMNVSVDAYNRSVDYKRQEMMGAIDDPYTGQKNLYINPSLAGKNTKVSEFYFELMRMNDAAGLGRGAHNSAISQEVTDYWMGKRTLARYSGLQGQDAQDAAEQAAKNLEAYASKVPENIRRYIDENAHLYAEFYSELNEYGVSKKLLDKNRIEGYNNETWKNIGGYEPIVELSESAQKGNVRLDTGGDVAAVIDQEMRELTYKVGDTPHYVDPELIRQSRINRMAQAEINRSMLDNYTANAGAAFSDFVTGDETEYARLIAEGRKTVKKAVDEATVNFVEDFPVNLAEASKMPKKSTKAISGAKRAKIADNMTFADTSDALTDLGVIYSGERYMTDGVDASNFDDWYKNTLNENARNYLGNALADYGPSYKANMQRKAEISSLRSAISENESRIAKRFPYRDAKVADLDGYFKSSDSKQAFTDKLYALPKDTAQELFNFVDKRLYEGLTYEDFKKAMKSDPEGYARLNDEYKKTMMDVINDPATRELQQRYPHFDIYGDINGNSLSSSSLRMIDETPNKFGLGEKNLAEYYAKEHGQATAILEMSPDQYLREIHNGRKGSSKSMGAVIRQSDVKRYADMTDVGSKMPMGFIEYNNDAKPIGQEGRHRALAAERMGDKKIPVKIIYNPENPPEILKKYMNVTQDFKKAYLESRGYTYKGGTFGNRFDVVKLAEDKTNYESLQRSIDKNKKKVEKLTAELKASNIAENKKALIDNAKNEISNSFINAEYVPEKYNPINEKGYIKFGKEQIKFSDHYLKPEEAFVLNTIRPGGDIDRFNGEIRRGTFEDPSIGGNLDTMRAVLIQNFGDEYMTDPRVLEAYGVLDYDDLRDFLDSVDYKSKEFRDAVDDMLVNGNARLKEPRVFFKGVSSSGNKVNQASDLSWIGSGKYDDDSYQFVTLDERAARKKYTNDPGNDFVFRYHLPADQGVFYYGHVNRGTNDGGAIVLPPIKDAKVVRSGSFAEDGTEYIDIYVGDAKKNIPKDFRKIREFEAELKASKAGADTVNFKNLKLAMGNGGRDFEYGLRRAYLAGSDEFAKSGMMRDAAKRYRTGREAFRDGVFVAKARDALSSIPWKDTDNYVLDLFDTFENATDDYLDNLGKHAGIKKAVSTIGGAEAADVEVEYYLLKKLQANSDDVHASIQEQIRDMVKGADMSSDDVEKLIDVSNELFDDYLISRVNEDALAIRDSSGRMVDEKEAYERAKEINERIVKAQGEVDTRYSSTGMIMYVDAAGRQAFATVDPAFASLYNRRIIIEGGDASKMAQINAIMSKTFRYGTTSVNLSSAGNQLFRDFGNAVMVGGAWRTIKAYADELEEVFGKNIVEQIKRFDPSGYEIKQLAALAGEMGVDVDKAAVSRELMRGSAVAPSSTERTLYAKLWKEINNDSNIKLDAMYKKSKEILAKYNPDELINGTRENYLRKRVYAANLNEAMKAGYSVQDARIVAEFTMNNATTNFGRQLYHLQSIAESTPYFRAAINGTKSFWRMWSLDPVGISGRITGGLILPTMYLVGASLANEEDKKVYMNIPEYQKEDSLVFVINGEIMSLPMPQELSSIVAPFRQFVEYLNGAQENDFWELMSNDLLGYLPVDLRGFTAIDMNVMNGNPTIIDRAGRGVSRVFSQVAPVPLKTIYMLATGTDPYTGKSMYDPSYWYWDDEAGSLQLMDYSQTKIGTILAKTGLLGGNAAVWSKVLSGIFGNTGLDILDDLAELFTAGAEKAATKAAENALERLTSPFSVPKYNLIDSQWKAAVRSMTAKKLSLINDERIKTINSELAQTKDPEKRQKLLAERESLVGDYRKEVANMARRLTEELGGEFDRLKLAAVIQLLNFDTEPSWQAGSQESSDDATSLFYSGRNAALSMMSQMGIEASNDMSAFGYLAKDKDGNIVVKYNTPVTILDLKNTQMGLSDYHLANIKAIISQDGLYDKHEAISNQIQKIYGKGKLSNSDYQTIEAIQINWNAEVAKALAEYIDKYSAESAINNKKVRDYLKTYIEVPASWEKNNKGKRVYGKTLGDRGSLKDAYYSSWLKTMFNINDPYKGQY